MKIGRVLVAHQFIISILMLTISIPMSSLAQVGGAVPDCGQIKTLQSEVKARSYQARYAEEGFQYLDEIAKDANRLRKVSASLAVGSGLLMMGSGAAMLAQGFGGSFGSITVISVAIRLIPTEMGTIIAGLTTGSDTLATLGGFLAGHFDAVYFITTGMYQLIAGDQKVDIDLFKLEKTEASIQEMIWKISGRIQERIENPPGTISNSLSLGGKNANHFGQIAELSEIRARLSYDLLTISKGKLGLLEAACRP